MRVLSGVGLAGLLLLAGCRSPYVSAKVMNETGGPVSLVEVDYPSASFGTESLAVNADVLRTGSRCWGRER